MTCSILCTYQAPDKHQASAKQAISMRAFMDDALMNFWYTMHPLCSWCLATLRNCLVADWPRALMEHELFETVAVAQLVGQDAGRAGSQLSSQFMSQHTPQLTSQHTSQFMSQHTSQHTPQHTSQHTFMHTSQLQHLSASQASSEQLAPTQNSTTLDQGPSYTQSPAGSPSDGVYRQSLQQLYCYDMGLEPDSGGPDMNGSITSRTSRSYFVEHHQQNFRVLFRGLRLKVSSPRLSSHVTAHVTALLILYLFVNVYMIHPTPAMPGCPPTPNLHPQFPTNQPPHTRQNMRTST